MKSSSRKDLIIRDLQIFRPDGPVFSKSFISGPVMLKPLLLKSEEDRSERATLEASVLSN